MANYSKMNLDELGGFIELEELGFGSWTPERDGKGKTEAVIMHFKVRGLNQLQFGLRIKSRERADEIVRLLSEYRDEVWPNG